MNEILIVDIEADGLYDNVTQIHCICIKVKGEENVSMYHNSSSIRSNASGTIEQGLQRLQNAALIVGHNWIDYDTRVITKFFPEYVTHINKIRDTLIRSYMFNPAREKHKDCPTSKTTIVGRKSIGAHSLENFGYIVGRGKVEHEDWTKLTDDMIHRCVEDVHITDLVDDYLEREKGNWDWSKAEKIENQFRFILSEQEGHGVLVDRNHLDWCIEQLTAKINKIEREVLPKIPLNVVKYENPTKGLKADGTSTSYSMRYFEDSSSIPCGDYCKVEFNQINLNSDKQIKEYLLTQGWQPTEWNYKKDGKQIVKQKDGSPIKTSPKITEDSLESTKGETGKLIGRRITIRHRLSQIQGWKENIRQDNKIGAGGNSVGTNTARVTHRKVVNVPSVGVFYGKEMRAIFTVPDGYKMVGADLSALENRVAAHYTYKLDKGEFANRVLKECPHQYIADQLSIDRSQAKAINYGIMYGAGVGKVQSMLDCTFKEAKYRYGQWWDANPALKSLRSRIKRSLEEHPGYIRGIDGRKIFIRSEHSAMNALFQNAGSIINKMSTILMYKEMKKNNIDGHMVINMHDEIQSEIAEKDVDRYSKIVLDCYKRSGEYFNLNVPIEGEVKVGNCWSDTH